MQVSGPANKMTLRVPLTCALHCYMTWSLDTVLGSAAPAAGGSPTSRKESLFITVCVDKGSVFIFTLIYDANF